MSQIELSESFIENIGEETLRQMEADKKIINVVDKEIYFRKSFNEQMAWIGEEVEHIIKNDNKYNLKAAIQEQGIDAYGENGYTHVINRLFEIVKADPKNKALLREISRAEEELKAFLYDQSGTLWSNMDKKWSQMDSRFHLCT